MRKQNKGSSEWTTVIIAFSVLLLLIVVIAPFLAEATVSIKSNMVVDSSVNTYRAHAALGALRSNEKIMEDIRSYTINPDSELKESIKSNISKLLGESSNTHTFRLRKKAETGWEDIIYVESDSNKIRRYSSMYVASPSRETYRIAVGVGR